MDEWKRFTNWWTSGGAPILIGVVVAAVFVAAVVVGGALYIVPRLPGKPSSRQLERAGLGVDRAIRQSGTKIGPDDHGMHIYIYVNRPDGKGPGGLRLNVINHCDWDGRVNSTICSAQSYDLPEAQLANIKWRNKTSK